MSLVWPIILLICICIVVYIIYKRFYKKKEEGFQTSSSGVLVGTVKCIGTSKVIYNPDSTAASSTNTVTTLLFEFLFPPSIIIQIDSPIQIYLLESGSRTTHLLSGTIFAYNYPNIMINNSTTETWTLTTGLPCSSTSAPGKITINKASATTINFTDTSTCSDFSQSYGMYMDFCDIELNKMKSQCIANAVAIQSYADTLGPETDAEIGAYDVYETYNFTDLKEPSPTPVTTYDTSQELSEFDFGAPVPWDYENRMYNPADVLWGVIDPKCSGEIFKSAYNKTLFSSTSPLQFDDAKQTFTYVSPVIGARNLTQGSRGAEADERDEWSVSLKLFDAMANVYTSSFVDKKAEWATQKLLLSSSYGRGLAQQAVMNLDVNAYRARHYQHLIETGVRSKREIKKIIESSGQALMDQFKKIQSYKFNDAQIAQLDNAFKNAHGDATFSSRNAFTRLTDGYRAQAKLAEEFNSIRATQSSSPTTNVATDYSNAANDSPDKTRVTSATTALTAAGRPTKPVLNAADLTTKAPDSVITRSAPTPVRSSAINVIKNGPKKAAAYMASKAGSLSIKFARALGGMAEGASVIIAAAVGFGGLIGSVGGPAGIAAGQALGAKVGLALSVILGLFVVSCCSFVPAILGAYIPDDAVCPPGYTNIYENIIKACGGNEIVWMLITSIPLIGDGIGTFAPYLCSKYDSNSLLQDVVLKKPPVFPDYYYDSSLSIYPDFQKTALSGKEAWFKDQRKYQKDGIAPVWVDFSDSRLLDRMAQYYYKIAKRFAVNNYDGTYSFEYISKIYGVIASTFTCCDIQCEIRKKTYYESTGIQQSDYIVPVNPEYKLTYHDRRFYFYVLEPYSTTELPSSHLVKMETYFKTTDIYNKTYDGYLFLSKETRNTYLSGSSEQLDLLMTDNINRYVVSGCTNVDGTAPNAYEVNDEGQYVGDAIVSVGGKSVKILGANKNASSDMKYYPPALSFNDSFLDGLINTTAKVTNVTSSSVTFTYTPSLANNFISAGTYFDSKGETKTYTSDLLKITINGSNTSFTGSVTATSSGSVTISSTTIPSTLSVNNMCVLKIETRSNSTEVPLVPGQCAESFTKINRFNQNINSLTQGATEQRPSYVTTARSPTAIDWVTSNKFNSKYSTKFWNSNLDKSRKVMPENAFTGQVLTGTVLGYIGMRVTWGGQPTGAFFSAFASSSVNTQYDSAGNTNPPSSLTGIIACLYEYSTKSLGTFVLNGRSITTQQSTDDSNTDLNLYYMYIDRGPTIPFSPGYTPYIDTTINKITQMDCINRYAVRYAVKELNKMQTMYASKILDIVTDTTNTQCAYAFEAIDNGTGAVSIQQGVVKYSYTTTNKLPNAPSTVIVPQNRFSLVPIADGTEFYEIENNASNYQSSGTRNNTYKNRAPTPPLDITIGDNDFKLIPTNLQSVSPTIAPVDSIQYPAGYNNSDTNTWASNSSIRRTDTKNQALNYSCASELVYNRIFTQFNEKNGGNPVITGIYNTNNRPGVYYPNDSRGSMRPDGSVICIYNARITVKDSYGADNSDTAFITMLLQKGPDPDTKPYDLVLDDYKSFYVYNKVPKYWIDVPPPLYKVETLALGGSCDVSISSCSNMAVIGNIVGQFNTTFTDRKIMKVRKAYTPQVTGSKVCDFEVEMLHTIDAQANTNNTYIRKESIRVPITANTTTCMWDMNTATAPLIDSGTSVTNNIGVSWLPEPYVWGTSMLSNVTSVVTNAITNFLSLDANNVLIKATTDINNRVTDIANSLESAQYLEGRNCLNAQFSTCRSPDIIQKMINRYYVDNFPVNKVGDSQRYITLIRKVGSDLNNNCQVEFIETVSSFTDYTKAPVFSSDPRELASQYNPTSYLRQYQFEIQANDGCTFDAKSVRGNVLDGTLYKLNLGSSSIGSLRSANSVLSEGELGNLSFPASPNVRIPCEDTINIIPAVKRLYQSISYHTTNYNELTGVAFAFNPAANVCEYSISSMVWGPNSALGSGGSQRTLGQVFLRATWDINYSYNSGVLNNTPDSLELFNPKTLKQSVDGPNVIYKNSAGTEVSLPYIYGIQSMAGFDAARVKKVQWPPLING